MTSFPGSPRLIKGALISYEPAGMIPQVVIFQYNPETLTRTLKAQRSGENSREMRLTGPPVENITLKIEIDAADQLEKPGENASTVLLGINPQLAALEMMLYPKSMTVITNTALAQAGAIEVTSDEPFTLFVWGPSRVLPVRITSFSITEQQYDPILNPIAAEVSLTLEVLTYEDFKTTHIGFALFLAHQIVKETFAAVGSISNTASLVGGAL
ncbi:MAG TPA: hypothetical protein VF172_01760 [Nitrososphaera sp.]|jgi:hypothetical protein